MYLFIAKVFGVICSPNMVKRNVEIYIIKSPYLAMNTSQRTDLGTERSESDREDIYYYTIPKAAFLASVSQSKDEELIALWLLCLCSGWICHILRHDGKCLAWNVSNKSRSINAKRFHTQCNT